MDMARIFIAMSAEVSANKLRQILVENGYNIIDTARDGHECLRKIRVLRPDLLLVEYSLPLMSGYDIAKVVLEDGICDVVLIVSEAEFAGDLRSERGFACLVKPLNRAGLLNTVELLVKNRRRVVELEREISSLKATLDTRKEVEKAKGLLMKHLKLSEEEAFKRIQRQSMDKGISMKEIAKAIIIAYDI